MREIWKFPLVVGENEVTVPSPFDFLSVEEVNGQLVMYGIINPQNPVKTILDIKVVGTGWELDDDIADAYEWDFLGTVVTQRNFVWHIFYKMGE